MAGLRDEVELDIAAALRDIDKLGASLTQQSQKFRQDLAASLDILRTGPKVNTSGIDAATASTSKLRRGLSDVEKQTKANTAATGKYGSVLQGVAQIRVVQGLVAFFGGRALISQINQTVEAASSLNEQVAQAGQVFGDSQKDIENWAETATSSVLLARREAIKFANDFGGLFRGAGFDEAGAAQLSKQFVQLGADIASFKDISIDDALTKLRAGLSGEIEPLRAIGFGFNDVETQAKAAQLGLRGANGELTEGAKTQARIAVILEKTALAQGDVARTSEGLANQQRQLRAEAEQLREEVGKQLAPAFLELVHAVRENLPEIGELATNLIPLLIQALRAGLPIGLSFLNLLVALSPVLAILADVLDSIPGPILAMVTAFVLLNSGLGPLPNTIRQFFSALSLGIQTNPAGKLAGIGDAFAFINPAAVLATVAVIGLTSALAAHKRRQQETEAAVKAATEAFLDQSKAVREDARALAEAAVTKTPQGLDFLGKLNLDFKEFADLSSRGAAGYVQFVNLVRASNLSTREQAKALEVLGGALQNLSQQQQAAAKDALNLAVARGQLTRAQVDAAAADNQFKDPGVATLLKFDKSGTNYLATLEALDPALAKAVKGQEDLTGANAGTASSLDDLDKALKAVEDQLDATFGRFLDAEDATAKLGDAAHDLAEALGEGAKKGESQLDFQRRLAGLARDAASAVEDNALALARAGKIGSDAASIQAEIRTELGQLIDVFPELRTQLSGYLGLLQDTSAIKSIVTTITTIFKTQGIENADRAFDELQKKGRTSSTGQKAGSDTAKAIADGIDSGISDIARSGRNAGRAAAEAAKKEVETTLRRSGRNGLNLGGFIVEGLNLGAIQAQAAAKNALLAMTRGLEGVVREAAKIDPTEANDILQAVEKADQATRDLAEARKKLGRDSIEAKLAELALAEAQKAVNTEVAKALDATEAYNEALAKVTDGVDTMTGSLRALNQLRDAQRAAAEARKDAAKEVADLARFDQRIAQARQALASATDETSRRRAQASLDDLVRRRVGQAEKTADAQSKEIDANLDLIDAQQKLVDLGAKVADARKVWEGYFRSLATEAGLTKKAIDDLVKSVNEAAGIAGKARTDVLGGNVTPATVRANVPAPAGTGNTNPRTNEGLRTPVSTKSVTYAAGSIVVNEAEHGMSTAKAVLAEQKKAEMEDG